MSFFKNIKRAFGMGDDPELESMYEQIERDDRHGDDTAAAHPTPQPQAPVAEGEITIDQGHEVTLQIFATVVSQFNAALPSFLAKSVDPEAQKRLLFQALDADVKAYLTQVNQQATQRAMMQMRDQQQALQSEIDEARQQAKHIDEQRNRVREQQLSAERQKRALSERVHDLETQLINLQAENEQFKLENQALVNKVRLAGVIGTGADASAEKALTEAQDKIAELEKNIREYAAKSEMADVMINDLNHRAAEAQQEAAKANERADSVQASLDEANEQLAIAEQIKDEIGKFEDVRAKLDKRIAELKKKNKELRTQVADLEKQLTAAPQVESINTADFLMEADLSPLSAEAPAPELASKPTTPAPADKSDIEPMETPPAKPQAPARKTPSTDPNDYQLSLW